MHFDPLKAFPYPVLREGTDDYKEGAFQASVHPQVEGTAEGMLLRIRGAFELSVEPLKALINSGAAAFAIIVDCRDTFTREYYQFSESKFAIDFQPGQLEGEFVISPCIVAKNEISDFFCPYIHDEFGSGPFTFSPGNMLAQADDLRHHISREHFAPVTSILMFDTDEKVPDNAFSLELSGEKAVIKICSSFRELIKSARSQQKYQSVVLNAIYFPAIVRLVSAFNEEDAFEKYMGKTWFEVMIKRLRDKGFEPPIEDPAFVAQSLLNFSLRHLAEQHGELEERI